MKLRTPAGLSISIPQVLLRWEAWVGWASEMTNSLDKSF